MPIYTYLNKIWRPFMVPVFLLCAMNAQSQIDVVWNPAVAVNGLTGTVPTTGIVVNAVLLPGVGANPVSFASPASNQVNLLAPNANNTFSTQGPSVNPPSQNLSFQFSQPVVITRFNMADIDLGGGWNDSFLFANGLTFSQFLGTNCNAFANGVQATTDIAPNAEFARWACSPPTNVFTINYNVTGNRTHAYLAYYMQVIPVPVINPICLNSAPPALPAIGQVAGTWNPGVINTNTAGTSVYTFTPNAGQALTCPIPVTVTVIDCCTPTAVFSSPSDDMSNNSPNSVSHVERQLTIDASNVIGVGNGNIGDGVIYHAGSYVQLTPGFEAVSGSQFSAEPIGCANTFVYRQVDTETQPELYPALDSADKSYVPQKGFILLQADRNLLNVEMINQYAKNAVIYSIDGKTLANKKLGYSSNFEWDISHLPKGSYLLSVETTYGQTTTQKFIRS